MLVRDADAKARSRAQLLFLILQRKEIEARKRLVEIHTENALLKKDYEQYIALWKQHIQPLQSKVERYFNNINEKRRLEHFLQGQAEHLERVQSDQKREPNLGAPGKKSWTLPPQVEKLPYAGPNEVGKAPKKAKPLSHDQADEMMSKLKKLDPAVFAKLLKEIGGK